MAIRMAGRGSLRNFAARIRLRPSIRPGVRWCRLGGVARMTELDWQNDGSAVMMYGPISARVDFDYTAQSDTRVYGIKHQDDEWVITLAIKQNSICEAACDSADKAKQLGQACENMNISEDDLHFTLRAEPDSDGPDQRRASGSHYLDQKYAGQDKQWRDLRVSAIGTPAAAAGRSDYEVAYKLRDKPNIFVGGRQTYP